MKATLRNLPLDIIHRCLRSLATDLAELELSYLLGNIPTSEYRLKRLKIDTDIIYYKHCLKLSERVLRG